MKWKETFLSESENRSARNKEMECRMLVYSVEKKESERDSVFEEFYPIYPTTFFTMIIRLLVQGSSC